MFKIEIINLLGEKENHYWMNKKGDDFLRFLPKMFGVPKENITAYVMEDDEKDLYEAYIRSHEANEPDMSEDGAIKIKRKIKARFEVGEKTDIETYEKEKQEIRKEMKGLTKKFTEKTKLKKVVVNKPDNTSKPVGDISKPIEEETIELIEIESGDELAQDYEEIVKEFKGKKLKKWPYDKEGNFLGNKTQ